MTSDVTLARYKYLHPAIINFSFRTTIRFWNTVSNVLEDNKIACCLHFHIRRVAHISRHDVTSTIHVKATLYGEKYDSLIKFNITLAMTFKKQKKYDFL